MGIVVLAGVRPLRASGAGRLGDPVSGLPPQGRTRGGPAALPALRSRRICPCRDRLVRPCTRPRQAKDPPRVCARCGRLRRHEALGLCSACWQRHPDWPFVRGQHLAARLADPPTWLEGFVADLAARNSVGRACTMLTTLGQLLEEERPSHPQALLERARRPGRSMGSLARALEGFFTSQGLAVPTDQAARLAAGRRQRRIDAAPDALRPAVAAFAAWMLRARERARRAGTRPRADGTIEAALATLRDLAPFLAETRGKLDRALVDVGDVEAFLATLPNTASGG